MDPYHIAYPNQTVQDEDTPTNKDRAFIHMNHDRSEFLKAVTANAYQLRFKYTMALHSCKLSSSSITLTILEKSVLL